MPRDQRTPRFEATGYVPTTLVPGMLVCTRHAGPYRLERVTPEQVTARPLDVDLTVSGPFVVLGAPRLTAAGWEIAHGVPLYVQPPAGSGTRPATPSPAPATRPATRAATAKPQLGLFEVFG